MKSVNINSMIDVSLLPDNPYVLLTPGPLSTTKMVKAVMLRDWCTWDDDYNLIVQDIRAELVKIAGGGDITAVLMQGSGTFAVEATIGSAIPETGKLLVISNGCYGKRIAQIADRLHIKRSLLDFGEVERVDPQKIAAVLDAEPDITHVAVVHCETTTGMLNPVREIGIEVKQRGLTYIVDAMSSFGGVPMSFDEIGCDFLISSANKCIQGVPGFGFVLAQRESMEKCNGLARSLSLDLFQQWYEMEHKNGKWRFTSPTHVVRAFAEALKELEDEGGVSARYQRYLANQQTLVRGMEDLGFSCLLPEAWRSPIITSFVIPDHPEFEFRRFYEQLKGFGWVIYPGKVSSSDTFRIGNIGDVVPDDIRKLVLAVKDSMYWQK